jgi:MbtH protein
MSNPFDDADGTFFALVNDEGQFSLWPAAIAVPEGWAVHRGPDTREACLQAVEQDWTDMRPKSLRLAMEAV